MAIALRPLRNPNPLGFPGGVRPGFDASHAAAKQIKFSGVSRGANFGSILKGTVGSLTGTPTSAINAFCGVATNYSASTMNSAFAGFTTNTPAAFTFAVICVPVTLGGATQLIITDGASGSSAGTQGIGFNGSNKWTVGIGSTPTFIATSSTPAVVANTPYFIAVSELGGTGYNIVVSNLRTGQTTSEVVATATAISVWTGTFNVGNQNAANGARVFQGLIAAVMCSEGYLSVPQLLQWAQDPWSFWYPRTLDLTQMLVGVSAATFKAAWAMNTNLPVLGTGTY